MSNRDSTPILAPGIQKIRMDTITRRIAAGLRYLDPTKSLLLLGAARTSLAVAGAPTSRIDARARTHEGQRFSFQAAFFCFATAQAEADDSLAYAMWPEQGSDIDCIFRRRAADGTHHFDAVQLKELPPQETAPAVSLESLLQSLSRRYPDSRELRVGIYLNRDEVTAMDRLAVPIIRVAGAWLYGLGGRLPNGGFLFGNLLATERNLAEFTLPRLPGSLTALPRSILADE